MPGDSYLTPRWLLNELGGAGQNPFDLDPACPPDMPWPTARISWSLERDGDSLTRSWADFGRTFLNPGFSRLPHEPWITKMAEHNNGIALLPASATDTNWFRETASTAAAILFLAKRITFHQPDGTPMKNTYDRPCCLAAYGAGNFEVLHGFQAKHGGLLIKPWEKDQRYLER